MKRENLITSKEYVISGIQLKLLNLIEDYMEKHNINRKELSTELGVTKGYISQLLNVSYDHKISKLVDLSLSCKAMPLVYFVDIKDFVEADACDKYYELMLMQRPKGITFTQTVNKTKRDGMAKDFEIRDTGVDRNQVEIQAPTLKQQI